MKITFVLNGTNENPYHKMGFTMNPFPQLGKAELNGVMMQVNSLDGDPIRGPEDIRQRLEGWDPKFVDMLIEKYYIPGQRTRFVVEFPDE